MYEIQNYFETKIIQINVEWLTFIEEPIFMYNYTKKFNLTLTKIICELTKDTRFRNNILELIKQK